LLWEIDEVLSQHGEQAPTLVLVQMGVGSFAHAVVRHYRREGLNERPVIVGVEPDDAACVLASVKSGKIVHLPGEQQSIMSGLNCGTMSSLSLPTLRRGINCFLTIPDDSALEATRLLAAEGIVAGETGAAGLGGLIELVESGLAAQFHSRYEIGGSTRVLLISTEGATDPASYAKIIGQWEPHGSPPDG
jgi:diaminopropionate ammonia-lyase